ncbi:MAG: NUDIX hydrolase [Chloroflexi bacterium]|nr:NUDIX hydrolase [Chloroflexota bacterium]
MIEFEILVDGSDSKLKIEVVYQPGRSMPWDGVGRQYVETIWQESLHRARGDGVPLYDGKLFRLERYALERNRLRLYLGDTGYKEYVATRQPGFHQTLSRDHLANPLAVCAALTTSDGQILVERRQSTDVYAGRYHVIGGFCERYKDGPSAEGWSDPAKAIQREVREETGLRVARRRFTCLGLVYDLATPHPELCFTATVDATLADVLRRPGTDGEVRHLESIADKPEALRAFILVNHGNISATGEPCLLLHGKRHFGSIWYRVLLADIE